MTRVLMVCALTLILTGCATRPPEHPVGVPVARQFSEPPRGDAVLTITRDSGVFGSGCGAVLYFDGQKLAKMGAGERISYQIKPGKHIVGADISKGLCNIGQRETQIDAERGATIRLRISGGGNGDVHIAPTAF